MWSSIVRSGSRPLWSVALVALIVVPAVAGVGTWRKEGNRRILDFCVALRFASLADVRRNA